LDTGDYNEKRTRNLRFSDVLGIVFFTVLGLMAIYLVAMLVYHLVTGRAPT
jgi:hypothetical protein